MLTGVGSLMNEFIDGLNIPFQPDAPAGAKARTGTAYLPDEGDRGGAPARTDSLFLSPSAKELINSGLDLQTAAVDQTQQTFAFELHFADEQIRQINSNGYYDIRTQYLEVNLSFRSELNTRDPETGEDRQTTFEFQLHLEAAQIQVESGDESVGKEDFLQLGRKTLDTIRKLQDDGKEFDSLHLNKDDVKALGVHGEDEDRLLRGLAKLIRLLRAMDGTRLGRHEHAKQRDDGDEETPVSSRREAEDIRIFLSVQKVDMSATALTVGEPSTDQSEGSAEAPNAGIE
jgi:hypothetical protein